MGAEPYSYFVPYQSDINAALQDLREREFRAGRFNPVVTLPGYGDHLATDHEYANIDDARMAAAEDGTRSILDLDHLSEEPEFFAASPLPESTLRRLYGTAQPTREQVEANEGFLEDVDRGQGVYLVTYQDGKPDQIYFGGYSFD